MEYQLYTVPRCSGCDEVKAFLDEKQVPYSVFNLREYEDKKVFGRVYPQISDRLKRNVQNQTILPLLVRKNGSGKVEAFAQEFDDVRAMFG